MELFFVTLILIALAFAGIAIKIWAKKGGEFEMVQLWVNLPAKHKMTKPRYQSLDKKDFPIVRLQDGTTKVKIIAGNFGSSFSPAKTFTKINIFWELVKYKFGYITQPHS